MVGKNSTTAYFELASKGFYTILFELASNYALQKWA